MNGERYLANTDSDNKEVHDLDQETNNCQIDEIIAATGDKPYTSLQEAHDDGYDNGAYCLGDSTR